MGYMALLSARAQGRRVAQASPQPIRRQGQQDVVELAAGTIRGSGSAQDEAAVAIGVFPLLGRRGRQVGDIAAVDGAVAVAAVGDQDGRGRHGGLAAALLADLQQLGVGGGPRPAWRDGVAETVAPGVGLRQSQGPPGQIAGEDGTAAVGQTIFQAIIGHAAGARRAHVGAGQVARGSGAALAERVAHQGHPGGFHGASGVRALTFGELLAQGREHPAQQQGDDEQDDGELDEGEAQARPYRAHPGFSAAHVRHPRSTRAVRNPPGHPGRPGPAPERSAPR